MDLEQIKYLPDEHKGIYMSLMRHFESDTWAWVKAWCEREIADGINAALYAPTWEAHNKATGARWAFHKLATLEQSIENEYLEMVKTIQEKQETSGDQDTTYE